MRSIWAQAGVYELPYHQHTPIRGINVNYGFVDGSITNSDSSNLSTSSGDAIHSSANITIAGGKGLLDRS